MSVVHTLENMDGAIAEVRMCGADARYEVISRLLHGPIDYSTPYGKTIGSRRGLLCSQLSKEGLWPERK